MHHFVDLHLDGLTALLDGGPHDLVFRVSCSGEAGSVLPECNFIK